MRIGIHFSDNDFYYTFKAIGMLFLDATWGWHTDFAKNLTKERIVELVNWLVLPCYRAYQNTWDYNGEPDFDSEGEHIREYLQTDINHIYLNEEIDEGLIKWPGRWSNSEFLYIDLDNNQLEIW